VNQRGPSGRPQPLARARLCSIGGAQPAAREQRRLSSSAEPDRRARSLWADHTRRHATPDLRSLGLGAEPWVVLIGNGHRLAGIGPVPAEELDGERIAVRGGRDGAAFDRRSPIWSPNSAWMQIWSQPRPGRRGTRWSPPGSLWPSRPRSLPEFCPGGSSLGAFSPSSSYVATRHHPPRWRNSSTWRLLRAGPASPRSLAAVA
jgi:hypothetical protein